MIGRFALACLDMAGTTVRDDGAVEAAFEDALRAGGIMPGTPAAVEAAEFVRTTMGWSKADVFDALLPPAMRLAPRPSSPGPTSRQSPPARAEPIPGALACSAELRSRGVLVCLTTGFAPSTRDACWLRWTGRARSTWRSRPPTPVGAARPRT